MMMTQTNDKAEAHTRSPDEAQRNPGMAYHDNPDCSRATGTQNAWIPGQARDDNARDILRDRAGRIS